MEFKKTDRSIYLENNEGKRIAEITYLETQDGIYTIEHTFVDKSLRGQRIASKLVEMAVEDIRSKNGIVQATCSYAKNWIEKNNTKE